MGGRSAFGQLPLAGLTAWQALAGITDRVIRIRDELGARDLAGIVLYDPLIVRYATDSTDMQLWCAHNAVRYAFVATEGRVCSTPGRNATRAGSTWRPLASGQPVWLCPDHRDARC